MSRGKWVDVTGPIYVYLKDASARMRDLQRQFPEKKFRVFGHSLTGFRVDVREES